MAGGVQIASATTAGNDYQGFKTLTVEQQNGKGDVRNAVVNWTVAADASVEKLVIEIEDETNQTISTSIGTNPKTIVNPGDSGSTTLSFLQKDINSGTWIRVTQILNDGSVHECVGDYASEPLTLGDFSCTTDSESSEPERLTTSDGTTSFTENENPVVIDENLTINGSSFDSFISAEVSITSGFDSGADEIDYDATVVPLDSDGTPIITGEYNQTTGVLSFNGTAGIDTYQTLLRTVTYNNSKTPPTTADRVITFTLTAADQSERDVFYNPATDHYYEYVASPGIKWTEAKSAAESQRYAGLSGYLVTVTSEAENDLLLDRVGQPGWIGASDADSEGEWRWVTGPEGIEASGAGRHFFTEDAAHVAYTDPYDPPPDGVPGGGTSVEGQYANWHPRHEPDNKYPFTGGENYAYMCGGPGRCADGMWQDAATSSPNFDSKGYYIEYGDPNETPEPSFTNISATKTVTVATASLDTTPPTAHAGPDQIVNPGDPITLDASASTDGETTISRYEWDITGNGRTDLTGMTNTTTFESASNYTVTLTVTDEGGNTARDTMTVEVTDTNAPTAVITAPDSATRGEAITFTGTNSTDDIAIVSFDWAFGDGTPNSTEVSPVHGYDTTGTYTVTLTVRDLVGNTDTTTHTVDITASTRPTVSNVTATNPSGQDLQVELSSDQLLDTITIGVYDTDQLTPRTDDSAALQYTLTKNDSVDHFGAPTFAAGNYTYTNLSTVTAGNYTIRVETAANDSNGDSGTGQEATSTIAGSDTTPPTISTFSVANPSDQTVTVTIETDEQLDAISVSGTDNAAGTTLTGIGSDGHFTETLTDGTYTYTATLSSASDGTFGATLDTATDAAGNDGASEQTDSVTVSTDGPAGMAGEGTADNPYVITNVTQLQAMAQNLSAHYVLGNDIDASATSGWNDGAGFDPVGSCPDSHSHVYSDCSGGDPFTGSLDGQSYVITDLTINRSSGTGVGLFGLAQGATVRNLRLENVDITGEENVGGVIGHMQGANSAYPSGTIENVSVSGNVTWSGTGDGAAGGKFGGIVGLAANAKLDNQNVFRGNVTGKFNVGGLVGRMAWDTSIGNSYAQGTVTSTAATDAECVGIGNGLCEAGGLAGNSGNPSSISDAYAAVTVVAPTDGAIIGYDNGADTLTNVYWDADIGPTHASSGAIDDDASGEYQGLTTESMQGSTAETNMNFDWSDTWQTVPGDYPVFQWEAAALDPVPVTGIITDALDGTAIAGATVSSTVDSTTTDANGAYTLNTSALGDSVTVTATVDEGFTITNNTLVSNPNAVTALDLALGPEYNGTGTEADPYQITTLEDLQQMRYNLNAHYELQGDLDASATSNWFNNQGFEPIGDNANRFTGSFDGAEYTITGLTIDRSGADRVGVFGDSTGHLSNVSLIDVTVTGDSNTGGLVGVNRGTITNTATTGSISGGIRTGGLAGYSSGTVESSTSSTVITASSGAGGLIGYNSGGTIVRAAATAGSVSGGSKTGGLAGYSSGTVENSTSSMTVTAAGNDAGGLIGYNSGGSIANSSATGDVTASGWSVGGLVGYHPSGSITTSFATGSVSGDDELGGLTGLKSSGSVTDSYWDTQSTGQSSSKGGTGLTTQQMTGWAAESNMSTLSFPAPWVGTDSYPIHDWRLTTLDVTLDNGTITDTNSTNANVTLTLTDSSTRSATATAIYVSTNTSVATVDTTGQVSGIAPGSTSITASLGGLSDTATLTVLNGDNTAPAIRTFSVTNPTGQNVNVSFTASEQLSTISVDISDTEYATLTKANFTETPVDGTYTYEATYAGSANGTYTATLVSATDAVGNDGASGESDSVTAGTAVTSSSIEYISGTEPSMADLSLDAFMSGGLLQLQVINDSADRTDFSTEADYDLAGPGADNTTRLRLTVTVNEFVPRALIGTAHNVTWNRTNNGDGTWTITITGSPTALESYFAADGSAPNSWPGDIRANESQTAAMTFAIDPLTHLDQAPRERMNGTVMLTDAQEFGLPQYVSSPAGDRISLYVKAPHFAKDGSVNDGYFTATLPKALIDHWGVSASQLVGQYQGTNRTTTIETLKSGAVRVHFDVTYSEGNAVILADTTSPTVSNVALDNDGSDNIALTVNTTEQLATLAVSVDGPTTTDAHTFTRDDFSETANDDGTYTYTLTTTQAYADGDGTYTVSVDDATDTAGNNGGETGDGTGLTDTHTLDSTAPTITLVTPTATTYNTTTVSLDVSADETATWNYSLNGTTNVSFTPNDTISGLAEGAHTLTIYATDTAGNTATSTVTFSVDTTAPTPTIHTPLDGSTTGSGSIDLTVTADESISSWTYTLDGTDTTFTPNESITNLTDGSHTLAVSATDTGGNVGTTTITFTVDSTPPAITIDTPIAGTHDSTSLHLNVSADETATWNYSLNGATNTSFTPNTTITVPTDGDYALTVYATDPAGNTRTETISLTVDTTAPPIAVATPTPGIYNSTSLALNVSTTDAGLSWNYSLNGTANTSFTPNETLTGLSDGEHTLTIYATDTAGNTATHAVTFTIDTTPPTPTIHTPTTSTTAATVDLYATADESISAWTYSRDGGPNQSFTQNETLAGFSEGSHTVDVYATDAAGNVGTTSVTFTVDTTAPTVTINAPIAGLHNSSALNLDVSADELVTWNYSLDGGATNTSFTPTTTLSTLADGTHTITIYATDTAGNTATKTVTVTIDTAAPTVTLTEPTTDATYNASSVPLNVTANESVSWTYSMDGGVTTTSFTPNETLTGLSDGEYTLTIYATDTAGNVERTTVPFTVDSTAPELTMASPTAGRHNTTSLDLNVSTNESSVSWTYSLNGTANVSFTPNETLTNLGEGPHTLTIYATDAGGNTASQTVPVTIDTTAPTPVIDAPTTGATLGSTSVALNVSADEPISAWTYRLNDGAKKTGSSNTTLSGLHEGSHTVVVSATDAAGNTGTTTVSVTVDTTAPTLTLDAPQSSTVYDASSVWLNASADEPITSWQYRIDGLANQSFTPNTTITGLGEGSHPVTVYAVDAAGNVATASTTFTVDTTPPTITIHSPTAGTHNESALALNVSADESVTWNYRIDSGPNTAFTPTTTLPTLADGTHTITISARDSAGNVQTTTTPVTVDTTTPTVSNVTVVKPTTQTITFAFNTTESLKTITAAVSGAENATLTAADFTETKHGDGTYSYTATHLGSTDGTYTVTLTAAADAAGNDGATAQQAAVEIDTTAPTLSVFNATNPERQTVTISFNTTEQLAALAISLSGAEATTLTLADVTETANDNGTYTYTTTYQGSTDGTYTATLTTAVDAAGNDGAAHQTSNVSVNTEPVSASASASSYYVDVGTSITLRGTDSSIPTGATATYAWDLDGDGTTDAAGETVSHAFGTTGEHDITLTVTVGDRSDTDSISIETVDTTSPTVDAGADKQLAESATATFDVSGSSSDNVGISSYEWDLDGDGTTDATGASASFTYDDPGTYIVTSTVSDAAGNTETDTLRVTVLGPETEISTNTLAFGATATGSTTAAAVTITNTGTTPLNVTTATITGTNQTEYAITGSTTSPFVVKPGQTRSVLVAYSPTATDTATATLTLATNDTDVGQTTVMLTGTGVTGDLTGNTPSLNFGTIDAGTTTTQTVTITNQGGAAVDVTGLSITGAHADQYTVSNAGGLPETVASGDSRTITINYAPTSTGDHVATLVVETASDSPHTTSLVGDAAGPDIALPNSAVTFESVGVNTTDTETLTVFNHGDRSLTIDEVTLTGPNADQFTITNTPPTIPAGASGPISIVFSPAAAGTHLATLEIESNDPDEATITNAVNGTAVAPNVGVDNRTLDFGNTTVNETTTMNITVRNLATSKGPLTVEQTHLTGRNPNDFNITNGDAPFTLAPGEARQLEIAFTPLEAGRKEAQLQIISNAGNDPQIDIWLSNSRTYLVVQSVATDSTDSTERVVNVDANRVAPNGELSVNVSRPATRLENVSFDRLNMTVTSGGDFTMNLTHGDAPGDGAVANYSSSTATPVKYVTLTHSLPNTNYANTSVAFRVKRSALDNSTDPTDIRFHRYSNGTWNAIETTLLHTSASHYYFLVETPGFSEFVVTQPTITSDSPSPPPSQTDTANLAFAATSTVSFGDQFAGTTTTREITIKNTGSASTNIDAVTLTGSNADVYTIIDRPSRLGPGESATVTVAFTPDRTGQLDATLTVSGDAGTSSSIALTGRSKATVTASNESVSFGNVSVGQSVTKWITISVPAGAPNPVVITSADLVGGDIHDYDVADTQTPFTILPGESRQIAVTHTPSSPGQKTATLRIRTDTPATAQLDIAVSNLDSAIIVRPLTEESPSVNVRGIRIDADEFLDLNTTTPQTASTDIFVERLEFTVLREGDFSMNLTHSDSPIGSSWPAFTDDSRSVLKYVELTHTITNAELSDTAVRFQVQKTRLTALGAPPEEVVFYRYDGTTWEAMPTTLVGESNTAYHYRSETPGFSQFIVTSPRSHVQVVDGALSAETLTVGESVTLTASVWNNRSTATSTTLALIRNGTTIDTVSVALAANETRDVSFTPSFTESGTFSLAVNDYYIGNVRVTPAEGDSPDHSDPTTTPDGSIDAGGSTAGESVDAGGSTAGGAAGSRDDVTDDRHPTTGVLGLESTTVFWGFLVFAGLFVFLLLLWRRRDDEDGGDGDRPETH